MARAHWVQIASAKALPAAELRELIRRSYELVRSRLTKKAQRELAD
jgi:predicted DNA-binding protein (MmcQ/YjbR family)